MISGPAFEESSNGRVCGQDGCPCCQLPSTGIQQNNNKVTKINHTKKTQTSWWTDGMTTLVASSLPQVLKRGKDKINTYHLQLISKHLKGRLGLSVLSVSIHFPIKGKATLFRPQFK